jgi:hypothetical protein
MDDFKWIEEVKMVTTLEYPESWAHEKLSRKDSRRFRHLMYKHFSNFYLDRDYDNFKKGLLGSLNSPSSYGRYRNEASEKLEIISIIEKYKMTNEDVARLSYLNGKLYRDYRNEYNKRPQKEGRDNKGVRVGNGGGNRNSIRYPSKKRSKRVWKTFYKMFPYYAERDGWDGKKSSRINFKNKKK